FRRTSPRALYSVLVSTASSADGPRCQASISRPSPSLLDRVNAASGPDGVDRSVWLQLGKTVFGEYSQRRSPPVVPPASQAPWPRGRSPQALRQSASCTVVVTCPLTSISVAG